MLQQSVTAFPRPDLDESRGLSACGLSRPRSPPDHKPTARLSPNPEATIVVRRRADEIDQILPSDDLGVRRRHVTKLEVADETIGQHARLRRSG